MHYQPVEPTDSDMYFSQAGAESFPQANNDPLDDVFGGGEDVHAHTQNTHPSEMRRLQTDHSTAGYREGVNIGKQDSLQKGFDGGYTIGAAIGLQTGQILGVLEGIAEAAHENTAMSELLEEAKDELSVEKLFSSDFWKADGLPSYDMEEASLQKKEGGLAHPSIRKWTDIMEEQTRRWGINRSVLEASQPEVPGKTTDEQTDLSAQAAVENPLDW
jgi:hypothetical protein